MDPRKARAGAVPSRLATNGSAGTQSWRPSPSFREQQAQPAASTSLPSSSLHLPDASTSGLEMHQLSLQPHDPRRARHHQQQQQQQQQPVGGFGMQLQGHQGMNGFHAHAAGQQQQQQQQVAGAAVAAFAQTASSSAGMLASHDLIGSTAGEPMRHNITSAEYIAQPTCFDCNDSPLGFKATHLQIFAQPAPAVFTRQTCICTAFPFRI